MLEKSNHENGRNLLAFFFLTFTYSWMVWLPFVLVEMCKLKTASIFPVFRTLALVIGAFGPFLAAATLIARKYGWSEVIRYLRQALDLRIKTRYFALAILIPLLITAGAHYIVNLTDIDSLPKTFFPENIPVPLVFVIIPYFLMMLVALGGQEEFGWRGYAQAPLQQKFGVFRGSLVLGIVWGVWHLPLWFMGDPNHEYYSFFAFWLQIISLAIIIGWFYNESGKKVAIAWIVHSVSNTVVPFFPVMHMAKVPQPGYWLWAGFYALAALSLTLWSWSRDKSRCTNTDIKVNN